MKHKPFIYFEFAPYLYKEFGYTPENLINYIKKDLDYLFFDENLKRVFNIENFIKKLQVDHKTFFYFIKVLR